MKFLNIRENKNTKMQYTIVFVKTVVVVIALGLLYIIIFRKFGVGIPCVINKITGYKCPGCGMTHAISELTRGNLANAWGYNKLSITIFPLVCIYLLYRFMSEKIFKRDRFYIWELLFLVFVLFVIIIYGYLRNYL